MSTRPNNIDKTRHREKYINATVLAILIAFVAPTLYQLHRGSHLSYDSQASKQWLQPSPLNDVFPVLIGNKNWRLDYTNIEKMLWKSKTNASGKLLINTDTLELLEQARKQLPGDISLKELQRVSFLTSKSIAGSQGKQLSILLNQYHRYQSDYQSSLKAINESTGEQKLTLLKANTLNHKTRQEHYFTKDVAVKLFSEKNITSHYLNERRILAMSNDLTIIQKKERLDELNQHYKASLKAKLR